MKLSAKRLFASCIILTVATLTQTGCNDLSIVMSQETGKEAGEKSLVYNPRTVIPKPFPAIKRIETQSADKASSELGDGELVLGVTLNGESRAYPITMLCGPTREIINDELGGTKIAATW